MQTLESRSSSQEVARGIGQSINTLNRGTIPKTLSERPSYIKAAEMVLWRETLGSLLYARDRNRLPSKANQYDPDGLPAVQTAIREYIDAKAGPNRTKAGTEGSAFDVTLKTLDKLASGPTDEFIRFLSGTNKFLKKLIAEMRASKDVGAEPVRIRYMNLKRSIGIILWTTKQKPATKNILI